MNLSNQQLQELLDEINLSHTQFIGVQLGRDLLTADDLQLLLDNGIDVQQLPNGGLVDDMFKLGMVASGLRARQFASMDFNKLMSFVRGQEFRVLTPYEISVLNAVKKQAYKDIRGLGNKVSADFSQIMIEGDKQLRTDYERAIADTAYKAVYYKKSRQHLASMLGERTQDWARNFYRISSYIMHDAFDQGRAMQIQQTFGDDALVWKLVLPGACESCVKLYLFPDKKQPRLFKLSQLIANGSNIGVPKAKWKPVVGPTHPFCRCTLQALQPGQYWDTEQQRFVTGKVQAAPGKIQFVSKNKVKITKT